MFPYIHLGVVNPMVNMNNVNIMAMRCHRQPRHRVLLDRGCCVTRMKEVSKGFQVKLNDEWFIKTCWRHWNYDSTRSTTDNIESTSDCTGNTSDFLANPTSTAICYLSIQSRFLLSGYSLLTSLTAGILTL